MEHLAGPTRQKTPRAKYSWEKIILNGQQMYMHVKPEIV